MASLLPRGFYLRCSMQEKRYSKQCADEVMKSLERNGPGFRWFIIWLVLAAVAAADLAGYIFYKYRLRSHMDLEIMTITLQYMPLDNQNDNEICGESQPSQQSSSV